MALLEAETEKAPASTAAENDQLDAAISEPAQSAPPEKIPDKLAEIQIEDLLPQASPEQEVEIKKEAEEEKPVEEEKKEEQPETNEEEESKTEKAVKEAEIDLVEKSPSPKKSPVKSERSPSPAKVNEEKPESPRTEVIHNA